MPGSSASATPATSTPRCSAPTCWPQRFANPLIDYDCVGYFGDQCGIPTPEWRHRARVSWETNFDMVFSLGWRLQRYGADRRRQPQSRPREPGLIESWKINDSYENPAFNYIDLPGPGTSARITRWSSAQQHLRQRAADRSGVHQGLRSGHVRLLRLLRPHRSRCPAVHLLGQGSRSETGGPHGDRLFLK